MRISILIIALLTSFGPAALEARAESSPIKIIDLTRTLDESTIYWPTEFPFHHEFEKYGDTPGGYFYSSAKFSAPEHLGTHTDAPIHFNAKGMTLDQVPLQS